MFQACKKLVVCKKKKKNEKLLLQRGIHDKCLQCTDAVVDDTMEICTV